MFLLFCTLSRSRDWLSANQGPVFPGYLILEEHGINRCDHTRSTAPEHLNNPVTLNRSEEFRHCHHPFCNFELALWCLWLVLYRVLLWTVLILFRVFHNVNIICKNVRDKYIKEAIASYPFSCEIENWLTSNSRQNKTTIQRRRNQLPLCNI